MLNDLTAMPPGPILDPALLERLLAACWHEFAGDDAGMEGGKLLTRMEKVIWCPPILTFRIERHGSTVMGSSRATLQAWTLDLEKKTAHCAERRFRQVRPRQRRLNAEPLVEEVTGLIVAEQEDECLRWYEDGRVRVLIGKVLSKGSAVKQTLADRRKKFRMALRASLIYNPENCGRMRYPTKGVSFQEMTMNRCELLSAYYKEVQMMLSTWVMDKNDELGERYPDLMTDSPEHLSRDAMTYWLTEYARELSERLNHCAELVVENRDNKHRYRH